MNASVDALVAGLLAGYGVAIPFGAISVLVVALTARTSFRVGAGAGLGVAVADGLYAGVAVVGGTALATVIEPAAGPLRLLAVAILLLLATGTVVRAIRQHRGRSGPARDDRGLTTPGRAFGAVLALTLLNPTTILYFGALILGRQASAPFTPTDAGIFVAAVLAASASWQLVVAGSGSLLGRVLASPRGRLGTALVSSALIVLLALRLLLAD
ncbi:LysE family transporter [Micromonospora sp. NBC_01796]|uniref:LysE family transporter n=1 Tax=Micromonospora sp. NBC_01796 TaxID=2975987 RepID=UPI002DDB9FA7|nr:LysE family transporter [Micromonospora sp. NBC_01796]WSA83642.1 LysE family transporter [Micromonospora sp. NBC_01796]